MTDDNETPFTSAQGAYRGRGIKDWINDRKSRFAALVAAGDPLAEDYRAGYDAATVIYAELHAAADQRKTPGLAETKPSASPGI